MCVVLNRILSAIRAKSFSIVDRDEYGLDAIILVADAAEASAAVQALSFAFDTIFVTTCQDTFMHMEARDHCDDDDDDSVVDVDIVVDDDHDVDDDDIDGSGDSVADEDTDDDDDHDSDDDDVDDADSMGVVDVYVADDHEIYDCDTDGDDGDDDQCAVMYTCTCGLH